MRRAGDRSVELVGRAHLVNGSRRLSLEIGTVDPLRELVAASRVRGWGVEPARATLLSPRRALLLACGAIGLIEAAVLAFGRDLSPVVPALFLLVPVVAAGLLGGRLVAFASALVAALGFSMVLPPFGSPKVELGHDVLALVLFVIAASIAGVLLSTVVMSDRRRLTAEQATVDALLQVDADRAALLRSVSHDLRTPLATIRAAATDLRSFPHPPETHDQLPERVDGPDLK